MFFLYFNLFLSVKLDSLSCWFTSLLLGFSKSESVQIFYLLISVLSLEIQLSTERRDEISLTDLTPPYFYACPKSVDFVWFKELRCEVIIRFVHIAEIVDHNCLIFWHIQNTPQCDICIYNTNEQLSNTYMFHKLLWRHVV